MLNYRYLIHRLFYLIPVLFMMSIIVFASLHLMPGDAADLMLGQQATAQEKINLYRKLGLDRPLVYQYLNWAGGVLKGDFGNSLVTSQPVLPTILERLPASMLLGSAAALLSMIIGVAVGILAAVNRGSLKDLFALILALLGVSVPIFWLGVLLIMIFSLRLNLFPSIGHVSLFTDIGEGLRHLALPALTLGTNMAGSMARVTRSEMIEQLNKEYVTTAWAKGLPDKIVICKHALRNALIPVVTLTGIQLGAMMGGTVVVETIFGWPGVGSLLMDAILGRDFVLAQGTVLFIAGIFVVVNLMVDITYTLLDPQISLGRRGNP